MPELERNRYGQPWKRDDLILAFDLYCRIPFQQTKASNPKVRELAVLIGRTPASVARKLGNFGAFDPVLQRKGIVGLVHASKLDKEIWDEFHQDWNGLVFEAEKLRKQLLAQQEELHESPGPKGPSELLRETKVRVHQSFFREAVLSSYNETCCITGLRISECLIASHIIPWSVDEARRADPTNGLCLSATFDRLFDRGLITIVSDMKVKVSKELYARKDSVIERHILRFQNQEIRFPTRFLPSEDCLEWHRKNVFRS
jgi:putative restriction endonuclease